VAIIPARYGSSRLPGKPLLEIAGRPMIEHVYRRAASAPSIARVIVATDDARIVEAVERFGGEARLTGAHHASGSDRLAEVASGLACDIVVNVQGDEPLLDPDMIEEAIAPLRSDASLQVATLRRRIDRPEDFIDPNVVKVVVDRRDFALYFSRAPIPHFRSGPEFPSDPPADPPRAAPAIYKHIGLYVYRREFLLAFAALEPTPLERAEALEQLRALEHGYRIRAVPTRYESIGVDTEEDLRRVRQQVATAGVSASWRTRTEGPSSTSS
jgi:3-deoxy-manno-octulosonate cytidylyltransferase (CMP-KDO synthetase)